VKRISITDSMLQAMRTSMADENLDSSQYVVFETVAVTTRPLNKAGTIFNNATITQPTLLEMAEVVNSEGGAVPLILQHNVGGDDVTPSGKVFQGGVYPTDDGLFHELRTLFAMPNPDTDKNATRASYTQDIDNGFISEVSIGAAFEQLLSSANPAFDFLSDEADIMNFIEREDDEGNSIDAGETHVIAKGLRSWAELSLVVRGASKGAVISSASKQKLSKNYDDSSMFRKLAASEDFDADQLVTFTSKLTASEVETPLNGDFNMDTKDILAQLTAAGAKVGKVEGQLEASQAQVTELTASNETLTASVATLTGERDTATARVTELEAQVASAPEGSAAEVTAMTTFVDSQLAAAVTASGKTDVDTTKMTLAAKLEFIQETGKSLHQLVAAGEAGRSNGQEDNRTDGLSASQKAFLSSNAR